MGVNGSFPQPSGTSAHCPRPRRSSLPRAQPPEPLVALDPHLAKTPTTPRVPSHPKLGELLPKVGLANSSLFLPRSSIVYTVLLASSLNETNPKDIPSSSRRGDGLCDGLFDQVLQNPYRGGGTTFHPLSAPTHSPLRIKVPPSLTRLSLTHVN